MLTPKTLAALPDELIDLFGELESSIIQKIITILVSTDFRSTASSEWLTLKAALLRSSTKDIVREIAKATGRSRRIVERTVTEACRQAVMADAKIYRRHGKDTDAYVRSVAFDRFIKMGIKRNTGALKNLTASLAAEGSRTLQEALDKTYLQVSSGAFTKAEAVYNTASELSAKGITTVRYRSRTDYIDVAVRRATVTGINRTVAQMQEDLADEMDCDLVETTSHLGARPSHAEWQGRIFSRSGKSKKYPPFSETGYGTAGGLCGINCRHSFYPYFEGDEPADEPQDAEENADEYARQQKKRAMERGIRKAKRECAALKSGIENAEDAELIRRLRERKVIADKRLKKQSKALKEFVAQSNDYVESDRIRIADNILI